MPSVPLWTWQGQKGEYSDARRKSSDRPAGLFTCHRWHFEHHPYLRDRWVFLSYKVGLQCINGTKSRHNHNPSCRERETTHPRMYKLYSVVLFLHMFWFKYTIRGVDSSHATWTRVGLESLFLWLVTWLGLAKKWLATWLGLAKKWLATWLGLARKWLVTNASQKLLERPRDLIHF